MCNFVGSHIWDFVLYNFHINFRNYQNNIIPNFDFLYTIMFLILKNSTFILYKVQILLSFSYWSLVFLSPLLCHISFYISSSSRHILRLSSSSPQCLPFPSRSHITISNHVWGCDSVFWWRWSRDGNDRSDDVVDGDGAMTTRLICEDATVKVSQALYDVFCKIMQQILSFCKIIRFSILFKITYAFCVA